MSLRVQDSGSALEGQDTHSYNYTQCGYSARTNIHYVSHTCLCSALMVPHEAHIDTDKKRHSHINTHAHYICITRMQRRGHCWLIEALHAACKHKRVISDEFHHTYPPWQQSNRQPPLLLSALYSPAPGLFGNEWQVCVNAGADMSQAPICSPRGFYWEFSLSITPRRKQFLLPILPRRWEMF